MNKPSPTDCVQMMMGPESAAEVCADTPAGINLLQVYKDKSPAVVELVTTRERGQAKGSGFFVSESGQIATEYHNVRDATKISVITADRQVLDGHIAAVDVAAGVAIVTVDNPEHKHYPSLTLTDNVSKGETIFGLGHPYGTDDIVATAGTVQEKTKLANVKVQEPLPKDEDPKHDLILAAMQTAKGFSGGPVFKLDGSVPGIIGFGGGPQTTGIVPSFYIKRLLQQPHT